MFKAEREAYAKCALQPETQKWWDEHNKTALADHKDLISKSEQRIADLRKAAAEGDKGDEAVESLIKEEEGELRKLWEEMREIEESCE